MIPRRHLVAATIAVLLGVLVLAVIIANLSPRPTVIPEGINPVVVPTPTVAPLPTGVAAPVEDATLLSILPSSIAGVPVATEPGAFARALGDSTFVASVAAAAFGTAYQGTDLGSGMVARLRPDVYSDAFFRAWRDSYDAGACTGSGGIAGNAQAPLGGRTVYITSCNGDLRTYHVWLPERGALISLFSTGSRRFGEQLMSGLRP